MLATDARAAATLVDPATGRLLTDTVWTGATCVYDPDPTRLVEWLLDSAAGS